MSSERISLDSPVRIVGAGPTGALLAISLSRRGFANVEIYESRSDPRGRPPESGRSINLALADRGIHALKKAGVFDQIQASLLPMRGRMVHLADASTSFQPYGQKPGEVIYSISRRALNLELLAIAAACRGVRLHFEHALEGADFGAATARIRDLEQDRLHEVPMQPLIGVDGAASALRRAMQRSGLCDAQESDLDHGYKELAIPAGSAGEYRLSADALHIWPRGGYMLIALPNEDGSFTATLFLPKQGLVSFESLRHPPDIERFLRGQFPDAYALMPDCVEQFMSHPVGFLGTVSASPWHHEDSALIMGDAAHAIVPFHGQGMNCCFEDCAEFDECLARHDNWQELFAAFAAARKPDTEAIAAMSLENYREMRADVADEKFQLQQALSLRLEASFPQRFIPRYSMVMFHHEIPYAVAQRRGAIQAQILTKLTAGAAATLDDIDYALARREIESRLPPL